jgi:hypothetical protein
VSRGLAKAGGGTYTVCQVLQIPPDGGMLQLALTRATSRNPP